MGVIYRDVELHDKFSLKSYFTVQSTDYLGLYQNG